MQTIFVRLRPYKVTEEIVQQIKSLIKEGKLQPGEKLPAERTLSDLLGVGRSSLREAFNILEALGFVEIRNRRGIYVRSVSAPILSDPIRQILEEDRSRLSDLYGLRKDIELASAYLAAKLRTRSDLAGMKKRLDKMEKDARMERLSLEIDVGFHLAIAQASGNFLRGHILRNIFDLASDSMELVVQKMLREKSVLRILAQHEKIFRAIHDKQQGLARASMEEHLTWVEKKWYELDPGYRTSPL